MTDSYWTTGAIKDRAEALAVQKRIASALERIATHLETREAKRAEGRENFEAKLDEILERWQ